MPWRVVGVGSRRAMGACAAIFVILVRKLQKTEYRVWMGRQMQATIDCFTDTLSGCRIGDAKGSDLIEGAYDHAYPMSSYRSIWCSRCAISSGPFLPDASDCQSTEPATLSAAGTNSAGGHAGRDDRGNA